MDLTTAIPDGSHWELPDELYASPGQRGSYNPLHFVVRLKPEFFSQLDSAQSPYFLVSDKSSFDLASAFSTFFHETIHWWQHIGSTTGFMLSMAYPAQTHVNRPHLLTLLREIGPVKSLKKADADTKAAFSPEAQKALNIVLNNWHDVEFNSRIIIDPTKLNSVVNSPYFESVGHSLHMGLSHTIRLLIETVDPKALLLPDIRKWEQGFEQLRNSKHEGYYFGGPVRLLPIAALHIFEGQARFQQLQYLHLASDRKLGWDEFRAQGMLSGKYIAAFEKFLEWSNSSWPDSPIHPTVSLFLLLCDLAINPSDGFPFDIAHFESFLESNNPGFRFYWFCRQLRENPNLLTALSKRDDTEYLELSSLLCKSLVCKQPVEMAERVLRWVESNDTLKALLQEEAAYQFQAENFPVRVCFAKFLRFAQDRCRRPAFFCWPALHFVDGGPVASDLNESKELFDTHMPMFMSNLEGEIRPALTGKHLESAIYQTFNTFFGTNIVFDMATQWIMDDGPFKYDYSWLTQSYTPEQVKPFADGLFKSAFGVEPDAFRQYQ